MKIDIITDGNNQLGLGHIYQTLTLIDYLLEQDSTLDINLYTKSEPSVISLLKRSGCEVTYCSSDREILDLLVQRQAERIIFDKLDVSTELARNIKQLLTAKLFIFTNLTEANNYADVTLLADIGSNFKNIYKKDARSGKVEFFGPKYWILRPEFYRYRLAKKTPLGDVRKIMLIFGGSDPSNFSSAVLMEILKMTMSFQVTLVIGSSFAHTAELERVINGNQSNSDVSVYQNISNVAEMMSLHDVVFASPGLSFFESIVIGTPVVGFHQNELQKKAYQNVFPTLGKKDIKNISKILVNKNFIFSDNCAIKRMAIGEGKNEILQEILSS